MPKTSGAWTTFGETDTYSTGDANYQSLGLHVKRNIDQMLRITPDRRKGVFTAKGANENPEPVCCFVADKGDGKPGLYYLINEPGTPETTLADWEIYAGSSGDGKGLFEPNNTTLVDGTGEPGHYYIAKDDGTFNGDTYEKGDWTVYNGASWERLPIGISAMPPSAHTHEISEVNDLDTALANKVDTSNVATTVFAGTKLPTNDAVMDYTYSKAETDNLIANIPGGTDTFLTDFTVQLGGDKFLKWATGETVPAKGKTARELLLEGSKKTFPATYAAPSASLTFSPTLANREVGETINLALDGTFNQNDAGAVTSLSLKKDGTQISAAEPFVYNGLLFSKTAQNFNITYNYAAGAIKNDTDGNPSPAGSIQAGSVTSNTLVALGYYKIFFGATATVPADGTATRSLPQSRLENEGDQFNLNTGSTHVNFVLVLPPGKTLSSVVDLDALNSVITTEYILVDSNFTMKDAAGANITGCKKYVKTQATPYSSNHRHQINLT